MQMLSQITSFKSNDLRCDNTASNRFEKPRFYLRVSVYRTSLQPTVVSSSISRLSASPCCLCLSVHLSLCASVYVCVCPQLYRDVTSSHHVLFCAVSVTCTTLQRYYRHRQTSALPSLTDLNGYHVGRLKFRHHA